MSETLETVVNRLERLETAVQKMSEQLTSIAEELRLRQKEKQHGATKTSPIADLVADKRPLAEAFKEMRKRLNIPDTPTMSLEEVRESMVHGGIRPEDNEFSRAIIEERER